MLKILLGTGGHVEPKDFELCMKHFQREFSTNGIINKINRNYPIPYSVFQRKNKIVAIFGGNSVMNKIDSFSDLAIPNVEKWYQIYKWKIKLKNASWYQCETVKEKAGTNVESYPNLVVECHVEGEEKDEEEEGGGEKPSSRVSFEIAKENEQLAVRFDDLLICNESPMTMKMVNLTACTMVSDDYIYRILEWIEYHRLIGFQRFIIQIDSPYFDSYKEFLRPYFDRHPNLVLLVPFYFETQRRPEDMARQDCLFRSKTLSKFTAIFDVDEFFQLSPNLLRKNQTLIDFLEMKFAQNNDAVGILGLSFLYNNCFNKTVDEFSLAIESYQIRTLEPYENERQKTIYLTEKIFYVNPHTPRSYDVAVIQADPYNELSVNHYRWPTMPKFYESLKVRDLSLSILFSNKIKANLRANGYILKDFETNAINLNNKIDC